MQLVGGAGTGAIALALGPLGIVGIIYEIKVPAGQSVQLLLPVVEYLPFAHEVQLLRPSNEKRLGGQGEQMLVPSPSAKYPLLQSLHVPAPTGYVNLPTGHIVQTTDPTELNVPALQSVHLSTAPFENVPAAQGVQAGLPGAENFPAGHAEHVTVPAAAAK